MTIKKIAISIPEFLTTTTTTTEPNSIRSNKISDLVEGTDLVEHEEEEFCGLNNGVGFVVGGQDAKRGAFPFVALLGYRGEEPSIDTSHKIMLYYQTIRRSSFAMELPLIAVK